MKKCILFLLFVNIDIFSQMVINDTNIINEIYKFKDDPMALCKLPDSLNYENERVYLFESNIKEGKVLVSYPDGKTIWQTLVFSERKKSKDNCYVYYAGYLRPRGDIKIDTVKISGLTRPLEKNDTCALYFVKRSLNVSEISCEIISKCSKYRFKTDSLKYRIDTLDSKCKAVSQGKVDTSMYSLCISKTKELRLKLNNAFTCAKLVDSVDTNYIAEIYNQKKWLFGSSIGIGVISLVGAIYSGLEWHNDNKNIVNYRNDYLAATNTIDAHDASIKHGDALKKRNFEMAAFSASLAVIPIAIYQYTRYRKIENASQTCKDRIRNPNKIIPCNVEIKSDGKKHGVDLTFLIK